MLTCAALWRAKCKVAPLMEARHQKTQKSITHFLSTCSQHSTHDVMQRDVWVAPLLSHSDFPSSAGLVAGNILGENSSPSDAMEKFAKAACALFLPFRQAELRQEGGAASFIASLRLGRKGGAMPAEPARQLRRACKAVRKCAQSRATKRHARASCS